MGVYLFNTQKNAFIGIDQKNRIFLTTNRNNARLFKEKSAANFRNAQLGKTSGDYIMIYAPEEAPADEAAAPVTLPQEGFHLPDVTPLHDNPAFSGILAELNAKQTQFDRMLVDLYHYAYIHPQLSASKGYKLYRIMREVGARRSKVKKQIRALLQCEEHASKYSPRSELYDHLSDLL